ncbi:hypothetical protein GCM10025881_30920 [Pseudolysinimonas kribbensis]|uniref:Glycine cleavage system P-protein N-terminal domain-containing protein n=1 Tax=Pseudolysinimonas kribbensis TaxID=433641 RepID=A0ABQ6K6J7_9MICO|nr:hypothetical protein GCM10025881_30920 [Pseudolysinimonas kribbensis]
MTDLFADRHIGTDAAAQRTMLAAIGYDSIEALMDAAVPPGIRITEDDTTLPPAATERETLAELRELASRNRVRTPMIGLGYHGTITPSVIQRGVLENPSWYTAYTPYQPEISQGRLEALLNFQTMVADLTGLATANASMLDESTAVVEGMLLARRASGSASNVFLVDADALPQTKRLLAHRAEAVGIVLHETPSTSTRRPPIWTCSAPSSSTPAPRGGCGIPHASSRRCTPRAASRSSPPTCSRSPFSRARASSAPTSPWARASASACRSASAARTPGTWPCAPVWSGSCPAGWSA